MHGRRNKLTVLGASMVILGIGCGGSTGGGTGGSGGEASTSSSSSSSGASSSSSSSSSGNCATASASFAGMVQPILTQNCAGNGGGCHPSSGNLNLDSGMAYAALVNVAAMECVGSTGINYVTPGSPSTSYIIDKLKGQPLCSGTQMPQGLSPLSAADIQTITNWICEGAPNN